MLLFTILKLSTSHVQHAHLEILYTQQKLKMFKEIICLHMVQELEKKILFPISIDNFHSCLTVVYPKDLTIK